MGLVALIAHVSFWVQLEGLVGEQGILPIARPLREALDAGVARPLADPSLLWLWPSDAGLVALCAAGTLLSLLLMLDLAPALCALGLWATYLSLVRAGSAFLSFQWDTLLVESLLLAALYAPWRLGRNRGRDAPPSRLARLLVGWLLFRLMFESGVLKLTSGDPAWLDLTALSYHYETQPLPHVVSWFLHRQPIWLHQLAAALTFLIELGAPFLLLAPPWFRRVGAAAMAGLMLIVGLSGNYGFFNLLTIVLCVAMLDDRVLPARKTGARSTSDDAGAASVSAFGRVVRWVQRTSVTVVALIVVCITSLHLHDLFEQRSWPDRHQRDAGVLATLSADGTAAAARVLQYQASPFLSINSYGLFRVMTRTRPEIILEASDDGQTWQPYEFPYKPGDPARRPVWAQLHMPRLDWRLWFEALRWEGQLKSGQRYQPSRWFGNLLYRLAQAEPVVLSLLETAPLQDRRPRIVRARLDLYRFTSSAARSESGDYWSVSALDESGIALQLPP
jgi:hypothetical protein